MTTPTAATVPTVRRVAVAPAPEARRDPRPRRRTRRPRRAGRRRAGQDGVRPLGARRRPPLGPGLGSAAGAPHPGRLRGRPGPRGRLLRRRRPRPSRAPPRRPCSPATSRARSPCRWPPRSSSTAGPSCSTRTTSSSASAPWASRPWPRPGRGSPSSPPDPLAALPDADVVADLAGGPGRGRGLVRGAGRPAGRRHRRRRPPRARRHARRAGRAAVRRRLARRPRRSARRRPRRPRPGPCWRPPRGGSSCRTDWVDVPVCRPGGEDGDDRAVEAPAGLLPGLPDLPVRRRAVRDVPAGEPRGDGRPPVDLALRRLPDRRSSSLSCSRRARCAIGCAVRVIPSAGPASSSARDDRALRQELKTGSVTSHGGDPTCASTITRSRVAAAAVALSMAAAGAVGLAATSEAAAATYTVAAEDRPRWHQRRRPAGVGRQGRHDQRHGLQVRRPAPSRSAPCASRRAAPPAARRRDRPHRLLGPDRDPDRRHGPGGHASPSPRRPPAA